MKLVALYVATAASFFALGWFAHQPSSQIAPHEDADKVTAMVMWTRLYSPPPKDPIGQAAYEARVAGQLCTTRQHLAPDVPELKDTMMCMDRVLRWQNWWEKTAQAYSHDALTPTTAAASQGR